MGLTIKQGRAQGKQAGTPIRAVVVDLAPVTGEPPPLPAAGQPLRVSISCGSSVRRALKLARPCSTASTTQPASLKPRRSCFPPSADVDATGIHFLDDLVDDLKTQGIRLVLGNPSTQVGTTLLLPL